MGSRTGQQRAYYARIVPVIGAGLRAARIAVCGVAGVAGAVERLAGCRAVRWWIADDAPLAGPHPLVRGGGAPPGTPAGPALAALLQRHNTLEKGWSFRQAPALTAASVPALAGAWRSDPPDLVLGGGDAATLQAAAALARNLDRPAVLVAYPAAGDPAAACLVLLPGDSGQGRDLPDLLAALGAPSLLDPAALPATPAAWHTWAAANGLVALLAKAVLLHGTAHAAPDLDRLLRHEHRTAVILGNPAWPWSVNYVNLARAGARRENPHPPGRPLPRRSAPQIASGRPRSALIAGCGSLGSLVARGLAASGEIEQLVLVDGEAVDAANPVRQFFHSDQVGMPKAEALAQNLAALSAGTAQGAGTAGSFLPFVETLDESRAGLAAFRQLLRVTRPAVAVLTTGSAVDYALARVLRRAGIPHLIGRCYPRARYFEIILVDGRRGPCFGCLRGHLYTGPAPPPTPEERLRYGRAPRAGELQAEPATVVESGRAADVLAHLAGALACPRAARPAWLTALLDGGQTCLIGGNSISAGAGPGGDVYPAYGVALPGQVVAFGAAQILGRDPSRRCADCGRSLAVVYGIAGAGDGAGG